MREDYFWVAYLPARTAAGLLEAFVRSVGWEESLGWGWEESLGWGWEESPGWEESAERVVLFELLPPSARPASFRSPC